MWDSPLFHHPVFVETKQRATSCLLPARSVIFRLFDATGKSVRCGALQERSFADRSFLPRSRNSIIILRTRSCGMNGTRIVLRTLPREKENYYISLLRDVIMAAAVFHGEIELSSDYFSAFLWKIYMRKMQCQFRLSCQKMQT